MPKKLKSLILVTILSLTLLGGLQTAGASSPAPSTFAATVKKTQLGNGCVGETPETCLKNNKIVSRLNEIVNFLSGAVGVVVAGSIIFAGIQYSLAGDNSSKITAARDRIIRSIVAFTIFLLIYAFLQWIIPGGVFS